MKFPRLLTYLATFASLASAYAEAPSGTAWTRHVVDDAKVGADGVRFDDVNGDGLLDITTGWEEGGVVRAYINPGPLGVTNHWPVVEAGAIGDVEDAVFADLDGDGSKDIIASAEGSTRKINIFWAPSSTSQYLDASKWTSGTLYSQLRWMFALAGQVDGVNGPDIIIGGKDTDAEIALFRSPAGNVRDLAAWQHSQLTRVGWIMTLVQQDVDHDGDLDILFADRRIRSDGVDERGLNWLENPGPSSPWLTGPWVKRNLGVPNKEVMFSGSGDLDGDGDIDYIVPNIKTNGSGNPDTGELTYLENVWNGTGKPDASSFIAHSIAWPDNVGRAKAARIADVDLDGKPDIVLSFETATNGKEGLVWLSYTNSPNDTQWTVHRLSGADGIKHDDIPLYDVDGDGDLDVFTTEEQKPNGAVNGLGVIWYENPSRAESEASVVTDWNLAAIQVTKAQPPFTGSAVNSNVATRIHAIEAAAVYNAVNSIRAFGTAYAGYNTPATLPASAEAAAAQAARDVLVSLFPAQQTVLDGLLANSLAKIADGPEKTNGIAAGSAAASHILALRASDGSSPNTTYPGLVTPSVGAYQLTPNIPGGTAPYTFNPGINSQWGGITPFVLASGSQFRPVPPPAVGSAKYNTALTQVKTFGTLSSPRHTAEQTRITNFYRQDAEILVNEVARQLLAQSDADIEEASLILAATDLALADTRISEWDAKYFYKFWRPITALNASATGEVTNNYAAWQPVIVTPNHPSYPSGHSGTVVGIEVLKAYFGDNHALTIHSPVQGVDPRTVTSLTQIEVDNGLSRIYGGIHFSFDNEAGQKLGTDVSNYVLTHGPRFLP